MFRGRDKYNVFSFIVLVAMLASCVSTWTHAREDISEVTPQELINYPQKYWSQRVLFQDIFDGYWGGKALHLGEKEYYPFQLVELETCYANIDVLEKIQELELDQIYLFQGTVLHKAGSLFNRKPSFFIVIEDVAEKIDSVEHAKDIMNASRLAGTRSPGIVLTQIQKDLISYAKKEEIPFASLFDKDSKRYATILNVISTGLSEVERQRNTHARALFSEFLFEVFSAELENNNAIEDSSLIETEDDPLASNHDIDEDTPQQPAQTEMPLQPEISLEPDKDTNEEAVPAGF